MGDGTAADANDNDVYFRAPGNAAVGTRVEISYLFPSAASGSQLFWVDNANQDHILPGGGTAAPSARANNANVNPNCQSQSERAFRASYRSA